MGTNDKTCTCPTTDTPSPHLVTCPVPEAFNGWTNRETWAVALHINNDQGWQESVHEALREYLTTDEATDTDRTPEGLAISAGDIIRESVEETLTPEDSDDYFGRRITDGQWGALQDIGSLWRVSWTELGAAFLEDVEVS